MREPGNSLRSGSVAGIALPQYTVDHVIRLLGIVEALTSHYFCAEPSSRASAARYIPRAFEISLMRTWGLRAGHLIDPDGTQLALIEHRASKDGNDADPNGRRGPAHTGGYRMRRGHNRRLERSTPADDVVLPRDRLAMRTQEESGQRCYVQLPQWRGPSKPRGVHQGVRGPQPSDGGRQRTWHGKIPPVLWGPAQFSRVGKDPE